MPANSSGTTLPSSKQSSQRSGRTTRSGLLGRQYMVFGQESAPISWGSESLRTFSALWPGRCTVAAAYSPLGVATFSTAVTATRAFLAKAWAAGPGCPLRKAAFQEGPVSCSCMSSWRASTPSTRTASRRGVDELVTTAAASSKRERVSTPSTRRASSASAAAIMRAGISSRPISSNSSGMRLPRDHPRVSLGNAYGEDPDAGDDADALGHRDCAPGIEQIEEMRALEAKVIRSQHGKTALLGRSKLL